MITEFLLSFLASIAANCICLWLERRDRGS